MNALQRLWAIWKYRPVNQEHEALVVSFLAANPDSSVLSIRVAMQDHTRGAHDWISWSDRRVYRILNQLERESVVKRARRFGSYQYSLVATPEFLLEVS